MKVAPTVEVSLGSPRLWGFPLPQHLLCLHHSFGHFHLCPDKLILQLQHLLLLICQLPPHLLRFHVMPIGTKYNQNSLIQLIKLALIPRNSAHASPAGPPRQLRFCPSTPHGVLPGVLSDYCPLLNLRLSVKMTSTRQILNPTSDQGLMDISRWWGNAYHSKIQILKMKLQ